MRDLTDFRVGIPIPPPVPSDYVFDDFIYRNARGENRRLVFSGTVAEVLRKLPPPPQREQVWGIVGDRAYLVA
jgi:hypothetical protein